MENLDELIEDYGNIYDVIFWEYRDKREEGLELLYQKGDNSDIYYHYIEALSHYEIGQDKLDENNYEDALKHFLFVTERLPFYCDAYNNLGVVYAGLHQYDEAEKSFKKAIELTKEDYARANYYLNLSCLYADMGNEEEAKKCSEIAYKLAPDLKDNSEEKN